MVFGVKAFLDEFGVALGQARMEKGSMASVIERA